VALNSRLYHCGVTRAPLHDRSFREATAAVPTLPYPELDQRNETNMPFVLTSRGGMRAIGALCGTGQPSPCTWCVMDTTYYAVREERLMRRPCTCMHGCSMGAGVLLHGNKLTSSLLLFVLIYGSNNMIEVRNVSEKRRGSHVYSSTTTPALQPPPRMQHYTRNTKHIEGLYPDYPGQPHQC
jgi:hypothetical protein